jgi:V-type H+-transporting ATPase subunit G
MEIEAYRKDREHGFNEKRKNYDGSKDDFKQKMDKEKAEKLCKINEDIAQNKKQVIDRLLDMVYDIKPELHQNKRVE